MEGRAGHPAAVPAVARAVDVVQDPAARPFVEGAGVVPVHRVSDGGSTSRNTATFRTVERWAPSGWWRSSPKASSSTARATAPKTGAGRIALSASADDGTDGVVF